MSELGRRGGERKVRKGFATMSPQRRKEISEKAVAAKASKRQAEYNPHYDFLKTQEDFVETMLRTFDLMRVHYPERSADSLVMAENGIATVRRMLNPNWLSAEQLISIEERCATLQDQIAIRKRV